MDFLLFLIFGFLSSFTAGQMQARKKLTDWKFNLKHKIYYPIFLIMGVLNYFSLITLIETWIMKSMQIIRLLPKDFIKNFTEIEDSSSNNTVLLLLVFACAGTVILNRSTFALAEYSYAEYLKRQDYDKWLKQQKKE